MNKKVKVSIISLAIAIFFLSIGYFLFFNNKNAMDNITNNTSKIEKNSHSEVTSKIEKDSQSEESFSSKDTMPPVKENKYYIVYIKQKNGGSSFVPQKLNPGFRNDSDYHVNISFDDNGNIINDEKIIEIENFSISSQNKEEIKKIAGIEHYDEALKEIEERVLNAKKSAEEQGLSKYKR